MAVSLTAPQKLLSVKGVRLSSVAAGIRYQNRDDLVLIELAEGSSVAATFTQNKFCAAPVVLAKQHLNQANCRALLINAGNANAGTGTLGLKNAKSSCEQLARELSIDPEQVLPFSTGVIGEQLNMDAVSKGISQLQQGLEEEGWLKAANAIMTTDTIAKGLSKQLDLGGIEATITGIVKGSGMICPNMATLLGYVATDVKISQEVLRKLLDDTVKQSFNRISVDSDTSTNDAVVLIATGKSDLPAIESLDDPRYSSLYEAVENVMIELATSVVRDAEGVNKFVKIEVAGAESDEDCAQVAYTVAHSPLVKTALYASDANWGRILAAVGRSGITNLDVSKIAISINDLLIIEDGEPSTGYSEEKGQAVMSEAELKIKINLSDRKTAYHVWTSDLSHEYVSINADYRS